MHGKFKTATGGLGHCIIRQQDPVAAQNFYHALGMRGGVEYKIRMGKNVLQIRFMHCNDRDHTVAFGVPDGRKMLNHIMLEVDNLDDVGHDARFGSQSKNSRHHPHRQAFQRSYVLVLFPHSVGMDDRVRMGRAQSRPISRNISPQDIYGHQPEEGGFGPMPEQPLK